MKIYAVCNAQRKRADGTMPVYIVVYRSGLPRLRIQSGLYCSYAPVDGLFPVKEQNHKAKSKYLLDIIEKVELIVLENALASNDDLKYEIMSSVFGNTRDGVMSITECFDMFISERKNGSGGASVYEVTRNNVRSYDPNATVAVTRKWAKDYEEYLSENVKPNTMANRIANLKTVFAWAVRKGIASTNPFADLKVRRVETRKRSLSAADIRAIRDADLPGKTAEYRDMFMLMFYLIGVNAKDLFTARKSQLVNGRFEYNRAKTGKFYSIKVEPEAQEIIDRYKGKDNLLRVCEGGSYHAYVTNMAHMLKTVKDGVTSYYSRHSWASLAAQLEIPIETISSALGHSHGEKVTLVYVNYNRNKIDEANRKVIDLVNGSVEPDGSKPSGTGG